jgi:hypothetical protein
MANGKNAAADWVWVGRYVAVIALSLILAGALGHMDLFEKTSVGGKLTAAHVVEFLGFGAALVLVWLLAQRATVVVLEQGGKAVAFVHLILPVASLVVVALAYSVVLLLIKPFLGATLTTVFNWLFIVLILACAGWLVMAVLDKAAAMTEFLTGKKTQGK